MTSAEANIAQTILTGHHRGLGAKLVPFGGFLMPVSYAGTIQEHEATRSAAAIFDTCHMGEFMLSGTTALADLERVVTCDVQSMQVGQCRYGMLCNPDGGVIDDLLIYRLADGEFMLVVNAGTQGRDYEWISSHLSADSELRDTSAETGKIDIQGPASPRIVADLVDEPIDTMKFYRFQHNRFRGVPLLMSRTGYTGEIGFEFYAPAETSIALWEAALEAGVVPAGLGARDTLRLEVGMPLYGHELTEKRRADASGFTRSISLSKEFIGCDALRSDEPEQLLVGLVLEGRASAREAQVVNNAEGHPIGIITSGSFAPSLGYSVAFAYVDRAYAVDGAAVEIAARRPLAAKVSPTPFYTEGSSRKAIAAFL